MIEGPGFTRLAIGVVVAACAHDGARLDGPTNVAFGRDGEVYVADGYGNARVVVFSEDGEFAREWGGRGVGRGDFDTPHGIAIDDRGRIYVADRGNARVQIFEENGEYVDSWRRDAVGTPWALRIAPDGTFYVVDGGNQDESNPAGHVVHLDRAGQVIERFGAPGLGHGEFDWPHGVAIDREGNVYVADVRGRRVQKFGPR